MCGFLLLINLLSYMMQISSSRLSVVACERVPTRHGLRHRSLKLKLPSEHSKSVAARLTAIFHSCCLWMRLRRTREEGLCITQRIWCMRQLRNHLMFSDTALYAFALSAPIPASRKVQQQHRHDEERCSLRLRCISFPAELMHSKQSSKPTCT